MPKAIRDKFSSIPVRQERYRQRQIALGRCRNDGRKLGKGSIVFCASCLVAHRKEVSAWRKEFGRFTKKRPGVTAS